MSKVRSCCRRRHQDQSNLPKNNNDVLERILGFYTKVIKAPAVVV